MLAAQNAVEPQDLALTGSAMTFFQLLGALLATAIMQVGVCPVATPHAVCRRHSRQPVDYICLSERGRRDILRGRCWRVIVLRRLLHGAHPAQVGVCT